MPLGRPNKFAALLDAYQSNAYPAMVDDLSARLGVSAASICKLGIGWAPGVPTSKGTSFGKSAQGYWIMPARDDAGKLIGLAVRDPWDDDNKFMYPGGKQGLFYAVNPDHAAGQSEPHRGGGAWEYPSPCPVCQNVNETKWCAVSDNGAVCWCHRKVEGAVRLRERDGAALHVLRPDRYAGSRPRSGTLLPDSPDPVLVVEGWTDVAAALDLGFVAVGKPSNRGALHMLADLLRGREVLVLGENDQKRNGLWPGEEGMLATYAVLRRKCRAYTLQLPGPPDGMGDGGNKDLRAWKNRRNLTYKEFLDYAKEHKQETAEDRILPNDKPYTIAGAFLDQTHKISGCYTLRRWQKEWYRFDGTCYRKVSEEMLAPIFHKWADDKLTQYTTESGKVKTASVKTKVAHMIEELAAYTLIDAEAMPCWVNGETGIDPRNMVVFANGILDTEAYFAGRPDAFLDPTPDLFSVTALPGKFDPAATCPHWLAFLAKSLGEPGKTELLQEWMGYLLVPDTRQHKMMYLQGPPAAGKGTIVAVIEAVLGVSQTCASAFSDLHGFGLHAAVGKLAILMEDVTSPTAGEARAGLANLLKIVGEGSIQVNRKHLTHLDAIHISARVTMASNGYIDVKDENGATNRRLLIIPFIHTFKHCMDTALRDRLIAERAGITMWALEGLKRLRARGEFTTPPSMVEAMDQWRKGCSPFASFIDECCVEGQGKQAHKRELFDAYAGFVREHGFVLLTQSKFQELLRANTSAVTVHGETFCGIALKEWAVRKYLGRP